MNPFGQLLWREWRRSRSILLIGLAMFAAILFIALAALRPMTTIGEPLLVFAGIWARSISYSASLIAGSLGTVFLPFIAVNVLAGERADRSAEFLASLPVSRQKRLAAKVTFLGAVWLATSGPLLSIYSNALMQYPRWKFEDEVWVLGIIGSFPLLATALAWLLAAWIESPVIAGMTAIAVPIVIPWAFFVLPEIVGVPPLCDPRAFIGLWFTSGGMPQPLTLLVALALFGVGSSIYLRRLA